MINYQSQETRDANNAIAEKHLGQQLAGSGVDRANTAPKRTTGLAEAHSAALARRNAG